MTSAAFLILYPAFTVVDPALVQATLDEVALGLDSTVYGNRFDAAHGAKTAHELFISPAGLSLRTDSDNTDTSDYLKKFQKIRREVAPKFAVTS
jgi:diaminopimelate decarboxylase